MIHKNLEKRYRLEERAKRLFKTASDCIAIRTWQAPIQEASMIFGHLNFDLKAFINETEKSFELKTDSVPDNAIEVNNELDYEDEEDYAQDFEDDDDYFDNPVPDPCNDFP